MDDKIKYDHLKFLIGRFDHYYDAINSKGSFYIGLSTFLFGGIIVGYTSLHTQIGNDIFIWTLMLLMMSCCFLSIIYTIWALKPYTKDNHVNDSNKSLIFFGGIAKHTANFFTQKINAETDETILHDMTRQVHCLSIGLTVKYKRLKLSSHFLMAQFCLMLPLFYLIIKKL